MKPEAIRIIEDEHLEISAVLYAMRYLVKEMRKGGEPNFPLLRSILDFIVSYPDRWHHPKEEKYLFAAVKRRTRDADELIARLEREHALGYPMIANLTRQLLAFQNGDTQARDAFFAGAERYAELEWAHLRTEEDEFMPIAERVLHAEDWAEIHAAFRENENPLFGTALYQRIFALAPAPIGFAGRRAN